MIGVLLVEDSPTVRGFLRQALAADPGIMVLGEASDGEAGVAAVERLRPDVVVLDIHMPRLDGVEATRRIMRARPTPILIFCGRADAPGAAQGFDALQAGALALIEKPGPGADLAGIARELVERVRVIAGVRPVRRWTTPSRGAPLPAALAPPPGPPRARPIEVVAIGASTGGPAAVVELLRGLPADLAAPVLLAQHITPGFTQGLVEWLGREVALRVVVAAAGEAPRPGCVHVAPDDRSLTVSAGRRMQVERRPEGTIRPSIDLLFESVARAWEGAGAGVLLTGMGDDGARGLLALHDRGGLTIAQTPDSCVVPSMPRSAIALGAVDHILPVEAIAPRLCAAVLARS